MPTHPWLRRALVSLGLACLAAVHAADGPSQRYAVLSLIGDKITMVGFRPPTGSSLDQNDHKVVPTRDPALDNTALLAVDDAIKRIQPNAVTTLLTSRDPALYALQDQMLDKPAEAGELLTAIQALLQQSQATRLILVSRHRAEARFELREAFIGSGKIAGLGFYVDQATRITLTSSGELGTGYLAPYAYLAVSLIDPRTMTTIRRKVVTESTLVPTSAAKNALAPWDALTSQQKLDALERLIRRAIERAVPEVLAGE